MKISELDLNHIFNSQQSLHVCRRLVYKELLIYRHVCVGMDVTSSNELMHKQYHSVISSASFALW